MPKKIMIAGYYGFGNTGDEAILEAMIQDLYKQHPDLTITVCSGNPTHTEEHFPVQAIPWSDVQKIKNEMVLCDLVILGGGGLFHDYWGFDASAVLTSKHIGIAFYTSIALLAAMLEKPLMLYAVGIGPLYSEMGKFYVRAIAQQARVISVRDEDSKRQLVSLGVTSKPIYVTADPVYNLRPTISESFSEETGFNGNPLLGVSLRNWDYEIEPEYWERQVAEAIDEFLDLHADGRAVFVPFQDLGETLLDDVRVSEHIRGMMKNAGRTSIFKTSHSTSEKAAILAKCDLVMGMRLHALILAIAGNVPPVGLVYDPKVRNMMAQTGTERFAIDLKKVTRASLLDLLDASYQNRDEISHDLEGVCSLLAEKAHENVYLAGELLAETLKDQPSISSAMEKLLRQVTFSLADTLETSLVQIREVSNKNSELLDCSKILMDNLNEFQARNKNLSEALLELQVRDEEKANTLAELGERNNSLTQTVIELQTRGNRFKQIINKQRKREKYLSKNVNRLQTQGEIRRGTANELQTKNDRLAERITVLQTQESELNQKYVSLKADLDQRDDDRKEVTAIKTSRGWKLLWSLWQIRLFLIPKGSMREKILTRIWSSKRGPVETGARHLRTRVKQSLRKFSLRRSRYAFAFQQYKRSRKRICNPDLSSIHVPAQKDLVSVVLPVYNGGDYLRESIDSLLNQTYQNFEIIAVDDGSKDNTREILDEYEKRDPRIRVYHQENQKLPKSLTHGFRLAKGEFLTWTSHDNNCKPDYLEKMVKCLKRHPQWDMIYSNMDIIGEQGEYLHHSRWFGGYQQPPGSEHVHLPEDTSELNTWPNNFIGGAFMYRDRVKWLVGDYDALQYTREDYDYWMQVNSLLTLKHADFKDPQYDYRFHTDSLTDRDKELGITRDRKYLMVFDDFRRDFYLSPLIWYVDDEQLDAEGREALRTIHTSIAKKGHILEKTGDAGKLNLPHLWAPQIYLKITSVIDEKIKFPDALPADVVKVLLVVSNKPLPEVMNADWDLCLALGSGMKPVNLGKEHQGWLTSLDIQSLIHVMDIRVRTKHLKMIEEEIHGLQPGKCKVSVIICSHKAIKGLENALYSIANQSMPKEDYELLVVDNHPRGSIPASLIEKIRNEKFHEHPDHIRLISCPIPGLSHARNAGIAESRGEFLLFIDDDATAREDILEQYWKAYIEHPEAGVIGGHILLDLPEHLTIPWKDSWKGYWSHFCTGYLEYSVVRRWWEFPWGANWGASRKALLQIGGFRGRYGRRGNNFAGGEEIVAASLVESLGYTVAILPQAEVYHHVEVGRFTLQHLKKTIRAGLFTRYQAQNALHIPGELNLGGSVVEVKETLRKLTFVLFHPKDPISKPTLLETYYHLLARFQLMRQLAVDGLQQMRLPGSKV
jgi:O-antigen biosynthesis protein